MQKIIVIGAGIGGLASAIRMAVKGFQVTVLETSERPGGKIGEIRQGNFRWDTGPSLLTLPELARELFTLAGENPDDYFQVEQVDPICTYFYPDGTNFDAHANAEDFASEMEQKTGEPASRTLKFLARYRRLFEIAAPVFLFNSFHKIKNFNKPEFKRTLLHLHKLDAWLTMNSRNSKWFKTVYARQLFNRYATYNGSNPFETPATLNMIAHLEHNLGGYLPKKGMYQLVEAVYRLALKLGVSFHFNTKVTRILYEGKQVKGVESNQQKWLADVVISNTDARSFYHHLMPGVAKPNAVKAKPLSSSGIIFYWGVTKLSPRLGVHNILFSDNYEAEFDAIFKEKNLYSDPTIYIYISSKQIPGDAPTGSENWFVMINTPADYGQNWNDLLAIARQRVISKINKQFQIQIENYIVSEHVATPLTIEQKTGSWQGSLYGNASNGLFSAFNRHANFSRKFKNLYFVGGSVHPGGGIPLCLCSAKIVDDLIADART